VDFGVDVGAEVDSVSSVCVGTAAGMDGMEMRSQPEVARIMISKMKWRVRERMAD
jgi:hypothetical protein